MPFMAPTGEKMNESEIDSLMLGQEDENGSLHYEGTFLWFNASSFF